MYIYIYLKYCMQITIVLETVDNLHVKIGNENSLIVVHRLDGIFGLEKRLLPHLLLLLLNRL